MILTVKSASAHIIILTPNLDPLHNVNFVNILHQLLIVEMISFPRDQNSSKPTQRLRLTQDYSEVGWDTFVEKSVEQKLLLIGLRVILIEED